MTECAKRVLFLLVLSCLEIWIHAHLSKMRGSSHVLRMQLCGRGLLQLQLDLRTPCRCSWTLLRRSSCRREEAKLQERAAAARLLQPPALLAEGWGGVQPGQTRCTTTGRQSSQPTFAVSAHRLKVRRSRKVFQSGLGVAAGSGLLQAEVARKQGGEDDFTFLLLHLVSHLDHQLLWIGIPPHPAFWLGYMNDREIWVVLSFDTIGAQLDDLCIGSWFWSSQYPINREMGYSNVQVQRRRRN